MRTNPIALRLALLALTLAPALPSSAMIVTGRGLAEIYVDVRENPTLKPGDRLRVGEPAAAVAELLIVRIRESVAVCRVVSVSRPIVTGDRVTATQAPALPATDMNQDINGQFAKRIITNTDSKQTVQLPVVMEKDRAKQLAEIMLGWAWTTRTSFEFNLGTKYFYLVPTVRCYY